jgi:MFS family permease
MPRALFPALAAETFHLGARGAGLLYAAPSAGALIGALGSGWVRFVSARGKAVIIAVAVWGLAIMLAGFSTFSIALTLFFLAIAGAADVISAVFRNTMLQEATPDRLRGRVSALNLMVVVGGPRLGDAEAGFVASAIGSAPGSVVIGGLACLIGTGVVAARARPFRNYQAPAVSMPSGPSVTHTDTQGPLDQE